MAHCGHPHLHVEVHGKLAESLDILRRGSFKVESFQNHAYGIKVSVFLQEIDRMPQLVNRERLSGVRVKNAVSLHFEPHGRRILEARRVREVYENLIVELAQVIDGVVERRVERLSPAHGFIESDPHQQRGFAGTVTSDDDSEVSQTETAMDRVLEQAERITFVEFLLIHNYSSSSAINPVPYFFTSSRCTSAGTGA